MSALLTSWTHVKARATAAREDGMVAIEYVILGALFVAGIGAGMIVFLDDLSLKFQAIF